MSNDQLEGVKTATEVIGSIIEAAGDSPKVKEAGNELGQTALTITKALNNCLLPIAAVNYGFDRARKYFSEKFSEDIAEKTKDIPPENLQEPKASIAGPALQALAFAHEEQDLKEMYLRLLKSAMDKSVATDAHPAFVEIIRQLSPEEASTIMPFLKENAPAIEIRVVNLQTQAWKLLKTNLVNYHDSVTGIPLENPRIPSMLNNINRLGLVGIDYSVPLANDKLYDSVEKRPEYRAAIASNQEGFKVEVVKGRVFPTPFGELFAKVVGV